MPRPIAKQTATRVGRPRAARAAASTPSTPAVLTADALPAEAQEAAEQVAAQTGRPVVVVLPYGMTPAPVRRTRASDPIDLGDYSNEGDDLTGWKIVFDLDVDFSVFRRIQSMMENGAGKKGAEAMEVINEMLGWVEQIAVAWNFVNRAGEPLPQPREGGAEYTPMTALFPIARAFASTVRPPKA